MKGREKCHRQNTSIRRHFAISRNCQQTITLPSHGRGRWFEPSIAHQKCLQMIRNEKPSVFRPGAFYCNAVVGVARYVSVSRRDRRRHLGWVQHHNLQRRRRNRHRIGLRARGLVQLDLLERWPRHRPVGARARPSPPPTSPPPTTPVTPTRAPTTCRTSPSSLPPRPSRPRRRSRAH
jgi:hypothetical protein